MTRSSNFSFITGLNEIADDYDHIILDIFGVLHDGVTPYPGTHRCLSELQKAGKSVTLLSNSPRRAQGAANQLTQMGLTSDLYQHIVTSGEATHRYLKENTDLGHKCWFIGTDYSSEVLEGLNLTPTTSPDDADFILNSIPATHSAEKDRLTTQLDIALARDLPMICANPDLVVNIAGTQYECAGMLAKAYEDMDGTVLYFGKPHTPVYKTCHDLMGNPDKSRILAVGDSIHTDITGANQFGISSCFNLIGIHWDDVRMDHKPEQADLEKIKSVLEQQKEKPAFVMAGLEW